MDAKKSSTRKGMAESPCPGEGRNRGGTENNEPVYVKSELTKYSQRRSQTKFRERKIKIQSGACTLDWDVWADVVFSTPALEVSTNTCEQ